MIVPPPAEIGMRLDEVETPALLLDLDAFERNLTRLAERAAAMGVRLRPHAKTHKSAIIAQRQVALGAVGVCCQKVSEAEAMVKAASPTSWSATRSSARANAPGSPRSPARRGSPSASMMSPISRR